MIFLLLFLQFFFFFIRAYYILSIRGLLKFWALASGEIVSKSRPFWGRNLKLKIYLFQQVSLTLSLRKRSHQDSRCTYSI